jgi:Putative metallopeptidase/Helix-turn-helix
MTASCRPERTATRKRPASWCASRSAAPVARAVVLLLVLLVGAAPSHAQKAMGDPQRARLKMEGAVHEMGGDKRMTKMSEQQQWDLVEFVTGNMLFVGFHELGHGLVSQLRLPVLGREEDAVDSFATLAMLEAGTEFSLNVLVQAARGWFLSDRREQKLGNMLTFYDEHGLDQQRAFNIVCLMVGSDQKQFKLLADWVQMPEDRQQTCRTDYESAKYAWDEVLKPHLRPADAPQSTIAIDYEPGSGALDTYARSFRSIGFLETLATHASDRYVLPRPISIVIKGCGDSNAWWNAPTLRETLCYEMAEDFVELYRGYREKSSPRKKMTMNQLIAENVKRIRLVHKMSMESLATDTGLPQAWVIRMERGLENSTVDQLEKLARALKVETAAFFAQPSRREASLDAGARSRK